MGYTTDVDGYPVPEQYGEKPWSRLEHRLHELQGLMETPDLAKYRAHLRREIERVKAETVGFEIERLPDMTLDIEGIGPVTAHLMRVHFDPPADDVDTRIWMAEYEEEQDERDWRRTDER